MRFFTYFQELFDGTCRAPVPNVGCVIRRRRIVLGDLLLSAGPRSIPWLARAGCAWSGSLPHPYPHYPAVKIARLAVNKELRGAGIGYQLTVLAIGIIKTQICPHVGCRFIVLDAKQNSIDFYKRQGFTLLDSEENKAREHPIMFLDMTKHP